MTADEVEEIVQVEIERAMQGFIGQSVSEVTASIIRNTILKSVNGLIDNGVLKAKKFDVKVDINGNQVDVAVIDPDTGDVLDLKDFLYEDQFHACSDCGWSGTDFHACEGRPN